MAGLAKWLRVRLRTKWLWVRMPLLSYKFYGFPQSALEKYMKMTFASPSKNGARQGENEKNGHCIAFCVSHTENK